MNAQAPCPHCGAESEPGSVFCGECGRALPGEVDQRGPQIVGEGGIPSTAVGRSLQAEDLRKQSRQAAGALLAVALLQGFIGLLFWIMAGSDRPNVPGVPIQINAIVLASVWGIGAVFLALFFWARHSPLPAAITGLVIYVTVYLLDVLANPAAMCSGVFIKLIIILVLAQAISAGVKHRRLKQSVESAVFM